MDQENESNLGNYLKNSREAANFSIEKLSLKTRINANILKSLEAEDFKSLPSPAYLKGFVLNYAKMFSLDESEVIKKLEQSYFIRTGEKFPSLGQNRVQKEPSKKRSQDTDQLLTKNESIIDTTKSFMPFIVGAIIIAASFGGYKVVSNMINQEAQSRKDVHVSEETYEETDSTEEVEVSVASDEKETGKEEAPIVTSPPQEVEVEAAPPIVEVPETKAPEVKPATKPEVKKKKDGKRNFPTVEFKDIPTSLYTLKPNAPENKNESLMPNSYKAKLNPEMQNLYIHALDSETWVSYKVDDEPIQNEFIRKGKALFLQGNEVRMFFGNINVTRIFLNNTFIDATSPTGVKTIVFPQSAASKFKRPLFLRSSSGELLTSEEYMKKMQEEEQKTGNP